MQPASAPRSAFIIFGNAKDGDDDALDRWYLEVHGPDFFEAGVMPALHRYRAAGDYPVRHLTVWESGFDSVEEIRKAIVDMSAVLRDRGRIGDLHQVARGAVFFADDGADAVAFGATGDGGTLTVVEGPAPELPDGAGAVHRYGPLLLCESPDPVATVVARWRGIGTEGVAFPTATFADQPDPREGWMPVDEPHVSHWRRTGTLRAG